MTSFRLNLPEAKAFGSRAHFSTSSRSQEFLDEDEGSRGAAPLDPGEGIMNAAALIAAAASLEDPEQPPEHDGTSTAGSPANQKMSEV